MKIIGQSVFHRKKLLCQGAQTVIFHAKIMSKMPNNKKFIDINLISFHNHQKFCQKIIIFSCKIILKKSPSLCDALNRLATFPILFPRELTLSTKNF